MKWIEDWLEWSGLHQNYVHSSPSYDFYVQLGSENVSTGEVTDIT